MRSVLKFLFFTFAASWIFWAAWFAISKELAPAHPIFAILAGAVLLLGVFIPALVALALTEQGEGRAATVALLGRILKWDVGWRWYVFALAYMAIIKLSVAGLHRLLTGGWPRFGETPWYLMIAAIAVSTWAQAGEEMGWRGYALPLLSQSFGLAPASIILGIIWGTWHLPLFFLSGSDKLGQSFPLYLLQVTALSVAMAWLYWRTRGSLLLVMLFHASVNNTKDIVPSADPNATSPWALSQSLVAWLTVVLLWTAAAYFLLRMRRVRKLEANSY